MKKLRKRLSVICAISLMISCVCVTTANAASSSESFKVLAIGNSFSIDATEYLYKVAADLGETDIVIGNMYQGSCTLATHWTCAKNNRADYTSVDRKRVNRINLKQSVKFNSNFVCCFVAVCWDFNDPVKFVFIVYAKLDICVSNIYSK